MSAPLEGFLRRLEAMRDVDASPLHRGAQRAAQRVTHALAQRGVRANISVVKQDTGVVVHHQAEHTALVRGALHAELPRIRQELHG